MKKSNQKIKVTKLIKVTNKSKGKLSYVLSSAKKSSKSFKKYFSINKTTGKLTVKKKLAKGTYAVKIKVTSKATKNYNTKSAYVTVKVKVS